MKNNYRKKPLLFFYGFLLYSIVLFCCMFFIQACKEARPEIETIYPRIGMMGDVLSIRGRGFGDERNESFITIAGTSPTSSSYLSWSDKEISVRVPEFGEAGLVYVHRGKKRSNPALFPR